jgi:hypothetical protein
MQRRRHSFLSRIILAAGILPLLVFGVSAHAESLAVAKNTVLATPKFDFSSVRTAQQRAEDNRVILLSNVSGMIATPMDHGSGGDTSGNGGDTSHRKDTTGHKGHDGHGSKDTSSHQGHDSTSHGGRDSSSSHDSTSHGGHDSTSHGNRDSSSSHDSTSHGGDTSHDGHGKGDTLSNGHHRNEDSVEHVRDSMIIGHLDSLFHAKDSSHIAHRDSLGDTDSTSDSSHSGKGDTVTQGGKDTVRIGHHDHGNQDSLFRSMKDSVEHVRDSLIIGHLDSLFARRDSVEDAKHGGKDTGHRHAADPGNGLNTRNSNALAKNVIGAVPNSVSLGQNYPNPFTRNTSIEYTLPYSEEITLTVYSLAGQKVVTLTEGTQSAGSHQVTFDASQLFDGAYFYSLRTSDGTVKTMRMIVNK